MKQLSTGRSGGFTLVEMLAVMGIIAVLLGVTLPALRGYNNAESRHAAVGAVMATLDRARMMAIADGLSTYVVVLAYGNSPAPFQASSSFKSTVFGRAYAIFEDDNNVDFTPVQQTPWMYLPSSMAFKVDQTNSNYTSITNRGPLTTSDPPFLVTSAVLASGSSSAVVRLPYLKFDSTGVADETNLSLLRVLMFPGTVTSNGGTEIATQVASSSPAQLIEEIDVNPATGRSQYIINAANNLATTQGAQ